MKNKTQKRRKPGDALLDRVVVEAAKRGIDGRALAAAIRTARNGNTVPQLKRLPADVHKRAIALLQQPDGVAVLKRAETGTIRVFSRKGHARLRDSGQRCGKAQAARLRAAKGAKGSK